MLNTNDFIVMRCEVLMRTEMKSKKLSLHLSQNVFKN